MGQTPKQKHEAGPEEYGLIPDDVEKLEGNPANFFPAARPAPSTKLDKITGTFTCGKDQDCTCCLEVLVVSVERT